MNKIINYFDADGAEVFTTARLFDKKLIVQVVTESGDKQVNVAHNLKYV